MSKLSDIIDGIGRLMYEYTGAPAGQIIARDELDAQRRTPPYLTIGWLAPARPVGNDEQKMYTLDDGTSVHRITGNRIGTLSIQGYGELTSDWMEVWRLNLGDRQLIRRLGEDVNVSVYSSSPITDVTQLVESSLERRYSMDLEVGYSASVERPVVNVNTLGVTSTLNSQTQPDPLVLNQDIDTTP